MKASELSTGIGSVALIELTSADDNCFPDGLSVGAEVQLYNSPERGPVLRVGLDFIRIKAPNAPAGRRLDDVLARDLPSISWVARVENANGKLHGILVQVHSFLPPALPLSERISFCVDESSLDVLRQRHSIFTFDRACAFLRNEFIVEGLIGAPRDRLIVSLGRSIPGEHMSEFRILGRRLNMDVRRRAVASDAGSGSAFFITRITVAKSRRDSTSSACRLMSLTGVDFLDATKNSVSLAVRSELDTLVQQAGSYLGVWQEYNELERSKYEAKAERFGSCRYNSWRSERGEIWFKCPNLDGDMRERIRNIEKDDNHLQATQKQSSDLDSSADTRVFVGQFGRIEGDELVLLAPETESRIEPPKSGFLSVSIFGDRKRLQRRERARDLIASGRCPLQWLGLLLEGRAAPAVPYRRHDALSPAARKAFRGDPTPAQLRALDVALNTPDIAIIQGPPGTGKTRVIAALQARLAELGEGDVGPFGETLLTSFQHDAVDTVAAASTAFGLPAFRIGAKSGRTHETDSTELWRRDLVSRLKATSAHQASTPVRIVLRDIQRKLLAQQAAPTSNEVSAELLSQVQAEAEPWLETATVTRLADFIRNMQRSSSAKQLSIECELALRAVRGLPTTEEAAKDDGSRRAAKALHYLKALGPNILTALEEEVLSNLVDWDGVGRPPGLSLWSDLRDGLVERLQPSRITPVENLPNVAVEELLLQVRQELEVVSRGTAFDASVAVEDLIDELESDPVAVRDEISRYATSIAATVQHSVGTNVQLLKDPGAVGFDADWPRFRSVIVDEAARCNPLDLMIPMSIAERRIVLVGDHRQLPHVLEPDIERELETTASDATREALGRSMFERLATHVRALEERDGIKRYVRLDTQYRMPPSLGTFVSNAFYEPYGEAFANGLPELNFDHGLGGAYTGKSAAWKEISIEEGIESGGHSKSRKAEANWIASEVQRLGESRPDLSIGVITFYSAQVDLLNEALERLGIVERDDGVWKPTTHWRATSGRNDSTDRLRIGTVDSFQGKQFDIVFLSLVRSNRINGLSQGLLRRKFGFLLLENRVCVAMSRQQRLLVAVGDGAMFCDSRYIMQPGISALNKYFEFCGGPHGTRI